MKEKEKMHILIILSWFGGYVGGYAITMQEFHSLETCEAARDAVLEWARDGKTIKVFCVQK